MGEDEIIRRRFDSKEINFRHSRKSMWRRQEKREKVIIPEDKNMRTRKEELKKDYSHYVVTKCDIISYKVLSSNLSSKSVFSLLFIYYYFIYYYNIILSYIITLSRNQMYNNKSQDLQNSGRLNKLKTLKGFSNKINILTNYTTLRCNLMCSIKSQELERGLKWLGQDLM